MSRTVIKGSLSALALVGWAGTLGVPVPAAAQETSEIEVGDFILSRSTDSLTDEASYQWARSGDEISFLNPELLGDEIEALELTCQEERLRVTLIFFPAVPRVLLAPDQPTNPTTTTQMSIVQLGFDASTAQPPAAWPVRLYRAQMPLHLVAEFVENARGATRLRARVGPFSALTPGVLLERAEELEFSLVGFTRALELLGCAG